MPQKHEPIEWVQLPKRSRGLTKSDAEFLITLWQLQRDHFHEGGVPAEKLAVTWTERKQGKKPTRAAKVGRDEKTRRNENLRRLVSDLGVSSEMGYLVMARVVNEEEEDDDGYSLPQHVMVRRPYTATFLLFVMGFPPHPETGEKGVKQLMRRLHQDFGIPRDQLDDDLDYTLAKGYLTPYPRLKPERVGISHRVLYEIHFLRSLATFDQHSVEVLKRKYTVEEAYGEEGSDKGFSDASWRRLDDFEARLLLETNRIEQETGSMASAAQLAQRMEVSPSAIRTAIDRLRRWPWPLLEPEIGDECRLAYNKAMGWPENAALIVELKTIVRAGSAFQHRISVEALIEQTRRKYGFSADYIKDTLIAFAVKNSYLVIQPPDESYVWFDNRAHAEEPYLTLLAEEPFRQRPFARER